MKWFAVQTRPQREKAAALELRRNGLTVFYAWDRVRRNRKRGRIKVTEWIEKPHFPGYVFARVGLGDVYRVNQAVNVLRIVSFRGAPIAIPDPVMAVIMAGANAEGLMGARDLVARKRFEAAQHVKFKPDGPLAGLMARVLNDDGKTVRVLVTMLGSEREIATSPELLIAA